MAIEWGPKGIRVNAIAPGMIDAGMSKPIFENPKVRAVRGGGVPLRCLGEASDIAEAVLFLDSTEQSTSPDTSWLLTAVFYKRDGTSPRMSRRRNLILVGGIFHDFQASAEALSDVLAPLGIESRIEPDLDAA